ncbi:hypothetical protein JCM8547_000094 [Rhodosporidiobolus lusitaniae]
MHTDELTTPSTQLLLATLQASPSLHAHVHRLELIWTEAEEPEEIAKLFNLAATLQGLVVKDDTAYTSSGIANPLSRASKVVFPHLRLLDAPFCPSSPQQASRFPRLKTLTRTYITFKSLARDPPAGLTHLTLRSPSCSYTAPAPSLERLKWLITPSLSTLSSLSFPFDSPLIPDGVLSTLPALTDLTFTHSFRLHPDPPSEPLPALPATLTSLSLLAPPPTP